MFQVLFAGILAISPLQSAPPTDQPAATPQASTTSPDPNERICRYERQTGTRMRERICRTRAEMEVIAQRSQELMIERERETTAPPPVSARSGS